MKTPNKEHVAYWTSKGLNAFTKDGFNGSIRVHRDGTTSMRAIGALYAR